MNRLTAFEEQVMEVIAEDDKHWTAEEIALAVGFNTKMSSIKQIQATINNIRKKHDRGIISNYIYSSPQGYRHDGSLDAIAKKKYAEVEADMRLKMGFGTILNGEHVIRIAKKTGGRQFQSFIGFITPKFNVIKKLMKDLKKRKGE